MTRALATPVALEGTPVLVGTASWSDRTLVNETGWYPKRSMKAAERMAYYAARFPVTELDATYRFPPTPDVARQWAERTPDGFTIDVRAWSLLVGHATLPASLWEDLQREVRPEARDSGRLYASHLTADARGEAWRRFAHALRPLHDAGRLGYVLVQLPHWLGPGDSGRALVEEALEGLPDYRVCVEFGNAKWLAGDACEETLGMLEDLGVAFACADATPLPPVAAVTSDIAVVRMHGRARPGEDHNDEGQLRAAWRYAHQYTDDELTAWVPRISELATSADSVHVIFNNCYRDYAVAAAERMVELLTRTTR